uniref:hypothetical protein n=1 Tax=unclassified Rhodococcus (in: high G+C Gram-positive bacteria) TaxID=192944 RepID=UPI0011404420|nr:MULTISPECIES: hypothetical protein [unclassified Rhodococcus (in: high G+C Gram-positive bacteria)]
MSLSLSEKVSVCLGLVGLGVGVLVPVAIFNGQSVVQSQAVCTSAILDFRKKVASYYALGADAAGVVKDDGSYGLRVEVQSSKDTIFVVCADVVDENEENVIEPDEDPWTQSPASLTDDWSYTNVDALYEQTAVALTAISEAPTYRLLWWKFG